MFVDKRHNVVYFTGTARVLHALTILSCKLILKIWRL